MLKGSYVCESWPHDDLDGKRVSLKIEEG